VPVRHEAEHGTLARSRQKLANPSSGLEAFA
jgi:hypothetical protein